MKQIRTISMFSGLYILMLISTCGIVFPYGEPTHEGISRRAVEISDLDEYLRNNLDIKASQRSTDSDTGQTRTVSEWIEYGSAAEDAYDSAGVRPLRHFHNPINNRGLYDPVARPTWYSSVEWGTTRNENIWNWNKAREYYYLALTSPTQQERSNYYAKMFRALGQVMHLIQDASVPHHVRNDQHLESTSPWVEHYEEWVRDNIDPMQYNVEPFDFNGISNFTVNQFWDQELYTGVEYANYMQFPENAGIAEYTNYHFLTEDTLFLDEDDPDADRHYFPHPNIENTDFNPDNFPVMLAEARPGITDRIHVINGYGNEPLAAVSYFANIAWRTSNWNISMPRREFVRKYCLNTENNLVFREYANKLVPKAVSYSSDLLNYFFKDEIQLVDIQPNNARVKFRLFWEGGDFTGSGGYYSRLKVYYDDENYFRQRADEYRQGYGYRTEVEFISNNEIWVSVPIQRNALRYVIVYNRPGLVVGKIIDKVILWSYHYPGHIIGKQGDIYWDENGVDNRSWATVRNAAYQEFLNDDLSLYPPGYSGSIEANWNGGGNFYAFNESYAGDDAYEAGMYTSRHYVNLGTFNYLNDFIITGIRLYTRCNPKWLQDNTSASLSIYKASTNAWPPYWDCGDQFLFTINGHSEDSMQILNLSPDSITVNSPNVWETKVVGVDPFANAIPENAPIDANDPGDAYYLEYGVATYEGNDFCLIIDYQEEE